MKKLVNGSYVACAPDEIAQAEAQKHRDMIDEKRRPLTDAEVFAMVCAHGINNIPVDDNTALRMRDFYPTFGAIVGKIVQKGFKFTFAGKLWRTEQDEMTIQAHYAPGPGLENLYSEVCESHDGTEDDPIPYEGNMVLESGRYYIQSGHLYRCTRDAINPVYHQLAELVGLYVELVW